MKKIFLITTLTMIIAVPMLAQKVKTDNESMWCEALPKTPLPVGKQTFSYVLLDHPSNVSYKRGGTGVPTVSAITPFTLISGLKQVAAGASPGVAVTIITEPFFINGKIPTQGAPALVNGNSVPTYYYEIKTSYQFRAVAVDFKGDTTLDIRQTVAPQIQYPQHVNMPGAPTSFMSKPALENEYNRNQADLDAQVKIKSTEAILKIIADSLNPKYGYVAMQMFFPISYAKGKSHNYSDLDSARDFLKVAMDSVTKRTRKDAHVNWQFASSQKLVGDAIHIWEKALKQESADKDARIHPELAACIRLNLAMAYMMLDEYEKSEALFNQCIHDPQLGKTEKNNAIHLKTNFLPIFKARSVGK